MNTNPISDREERALYAGQALNALLSEAIKIPDDKIIANIDINQVCEDAEMASEYMIRVMQRAAKDRHKKEMEEARKRVVNKICVRCKKRFEDSSAGCDPKDKKGVCNKCMGDLHGIEFPAKIHLVKDDTSLKTEDDMSNPIKL